MLPRTLPLTTVVACVLATAPGRTAAQAVHVHPSPVVNTAGSGSAIEDSVLPANTRRAAARLQASPRHKAFVAVPAGRDTIRAWVVYPQRTPAPVVVVAYDIFGMTPWAQAIADQLAAEGFVAIVPDFGSRAADSGLASSAAPQRHVATMNALSVVQVDSQLAAAAQFAMHLRQAKPRYAVIGFCMGGGTAFLHATRAGRQLRAAVVFYGVNPAFAELAKIDAPVLGLYAESDQAFVQPLPTIDSIMKAHGKTFAYHVYPGSEHAFVQSQAGEANVRATREAWPAAMRWLHTYLTP